MKLKFWKKGKNDVQLDKKIQETIQLNKSSKYPLAVQKIHNEFMQSAEESLLAAMEYIKLNNINPKADRLSKIGFNSVPLVVETLDIKRKIDLSVKEIDIINKYQKKYPEYKFITEQNVINICKKYNLVLGGIGLFKGFVPNENLKDIEIFMTKYDFSSMWITQISKRVLDMSNYKIKGDRSYEHFYHKKSGDYVFQRDTGDSLFYSSGIVNGERFDCSVMGDGRLEPVTLQICAPIKDMDTTGMTVKNYKLIKDIPYPVVLQPVPGGYLIVTAWGDESEDD
jgi:hypothetical protein